MPRDPLRQPRVTPVSRIAHVSVPSRVGGAVGFSGAISGAQSEGEGGSGVWLTLDAEWTAVQIENALGDRETQAGAFRRVGTRPGRTIEALEDVRQLDGWYAAAGI